jgi:hypothetical protein
MPGATPHGLLIVISNFRSERRKTDTKYGKFSNLSAIRAPTATVCHSRFCPNAGGASGPSIRWKRGTGVKHVMRRFGRHDQCMWMSHGSVD